ncbi:MAG: methionine biosynthesis protein MetW [Halieaceae bacterium]|jgi:methionine biosynthesis protein MetW|nr:methionine biosynthesis protein MetW [Halieaceae bacterium]
MRQDLTHIQQWIRTGARVLDLGCGDGEFLAQLQATREVKGLGLEIDADNINAAIGRGLDIIEQNIDRGLGNFADKSFDTVVMAFALQAVRSPHLVLEEMLRIGQECIVTFPNFGHWRCRLYLSLRGRMPVSRLLPYNWYDTPNIHFCTVRDFEALCAERQIRILRRHMVGPDNTRGRLARLWPNLFATTAIYHITR